MSRPYRGWSVFFRADKRQWVLSRDGRQKLIPRECVSKRSAVAWATDFLVRNGYLEADGTAKRTTETDTVAGLAERWIEWRESLVGKRWEAATVSNNRSHLKRWIVKGLGHVQLSELTARRISEWLDAIELAPNGKRNVYRTLVALLEDSIGNGWCTLDFNPAKSPVVSRAVPEALTRAQELNAATRLTIEECQALVSDPRVPFERRVKYILTLTLVARDGEICGLTWGAVDFEAARVRIFQSAKIIRRKSDPKVGKPKTKAGRRELPLHPEAAKALQDWADGTAADPTLPIFPGKGGEGFTRVKAASHLRTDLARTGGRTTIDGCAVEFHHLRHTALNLLREAGVDQETRDKLAGHAAHGVGASHYQHITLEAMRSAILLVPLTWAGVRGSFCACACANGHNNDLEDGQ